MTDVFAGIRVPVRGRSHKRLPEDREAARRAQQSAARRSTTAKDETDSRFLLEPLTGREAVLPPFDAPFIVEGRTKYPAMRRHAVYGPVLKSGAYQSKIGAKVLVGKWMDMPVFCLTLEERATCPSECQLWRGCYGNNMHRAHRFMGGAQLEERLHTEVGRLAKAYPAGFVVRLHILGDFYSVDYVAFWARMLATYKPLHVYGYTARWRRDDPIALALIHLAMGQWERFAMRFSNAPVDTCSTITIEHAGQKPDDAIICPVQLGQTESCSTCGLCWGTNKRIAFIRH